jgi:hypothetical protein
MKNFALHYTTNYTITNYTTPLPTLHHRTQMLARRQSNEELRAVGVRSAVGHAQDARALCVRERERVCVCVCVCVH